MSNAFLDYGTGGSGDLTSGKANAFLASLRLSGISPSLPLRSSATRGVVAGLIGVDDLDFDAVAGIENIPPLDGGYASVYRDSTAGIANLRTLVAGSNVSLVETAETITINASEFDNIVSLTTAGLGGQTLVPTPNLGPGLKVYALGDGSNIVVNPPADGIVNIDVVDEPTFTSINTSFITHPLGVEINTPGDANMLSGANANIEAANVCRIDAGAVTTTLQLDTNASLLTQGTATVDAASIVLKPGTTTDFKTTAGANVLRIGQSIPSSVSTTVLTLNGVGLEQRTGAVFEDVGATLTNKTIDSSSNTIKVSGTEIDLLIDQNLRTIASPAFATLQLPSTQTSPALVSGKLVLGTNQGGDLVGVLPTGISFPIGGATMPFKRLDDTLTSVIYNEPSAGLFSIIWDASVLSVGISFPASTYYGSTTVNVASSLLRSSTLSTTDNATSAGSWTISAGATMFLATRSTSAPTGVNQMGASGMYFRSEVFTRTGGDGTAPHPVFRIEIRKGIAGGSSFNVKWLY